MTSYLWIAVIAMAPPAEEPAVSPSSVTESSYQTGEDETRARIREAIELRQLVRKVMRREAHTEGAENAKAIYDLIEVFQKLKKDTSLTRNERIRLHALVRARLMRIERDIELRIRREEIAARREGRKPETISMPANLPEVLAQQFGALGQQMGQRAEDPGQALLDLIKTTIRPETWDDNGGPGTAVLFDKFSALHQQIGTMGRGFARAPGMFGGGANEDHGEELVELIQTVIAPQSWDVAGGPGSIYYWKQLHVLVVRQTSEVHGEMGDVLGQLRRAGNP